MCSCKAHQQIQAPANMARSRVRGGYAHLWASYGKSRRASEARGHGSAKISGKALSVQHKMGSKEFKNRSI
jgi:hypothetical protein